MLRLDALEVIQLFRKPGGADFVLFCNRVIRASCWAGGEPQSNVWTSSRTDAKDRGVDTRLTGAIPKDKSGYFGEPSIWQFKAADESHVNESDMAREANKPRARQWISEGSAYRIVICDHLTPDKKQRLLDALSNAVKAINASAPPPKVLSIDDIVDVANSFPALVLEHRPHLDAICILFDRWRQSSIGMTPIFVPPAGFDVTKNVVLTHVEFGKEVRSPVITLYGSAGVGKTRVALECLRDSPDASSMVLYTSSEDDVRELANMLVNDQTAYAVIVADECAIETREELSRKLMNFRERVRCVCIDNTVQRASTASPELIIPRLSTLELEKVLRANFEQIPQDRIRAYAQYCEGSVRLAADMCAHYDAEIAQAGSVRPVLSKIGDYYRVRLRDNLQRQAVETIALLKRVRHKGEAPTDLDLLCQLTGGERRNIEQSLAETKESPGWVEKGALYYRVTPDLIAMTAFSSAWDRWANGDIEGFLQRIPSSIQESFLQRVSESGSPEVRETVQRFFRRFADDFTPRDLGEVRLVNRFVTLIETDASSYLPALRRVVESATHDDLTTGPDWTGGSWGPRRQLVWTAERFAIFPEHFYDCEAILFTLARHETEPRIGNNATKTWQALFRFQCSGSSLPLATRLSLLRDRLVRALERDADLFVGALEDLLYLMAVRVLGPPVVGGRVPPSEWRPKDRDELKESVMAGLQVLDEGTQHPILAISKGAKKALVGALEALTRQGWVDHLRPFVAASHLDESDRAELGGLLKRFLTWGKQPDDSDIRSEYRSKIEDWVQQLEPKSLHARLVGSVGCRSIDHYGREKEWERELDQLAAELLESPDLLAAEIDWLTSSEAESAFEFGSRLGGLDVGATLVDKIVQHSRGRHIGFVRGYVAGLLYLANVSPVIVDARLDELEADDPVLSFQIALAGGSRVRAFDRASKLIKAGKIPAHHLRNFTHWVGDQHVSNNQVLEAIRLLIPVAATDTLTSDVIADFLGARLYSKQLDALLEADRTLVWEAISVASRNPGRETFWLVKVLDAAAPTNRSLAIQLACEALVGDSYLFERDAEGLLASWASEFPEEVMAGVGDLLLDDNVGWRFLATKLGLFSAIPPEVVIRWLESAGVRGAQRIARHIPKPFVDASGEVRVPKLTEFVLSRFEDDDTTFREFCAGTHSFQMYVGDIASQREAEAASSRPFFNHPLKRIREWARYEYESGVREAQLHREHDDELGM
jgi:hypothetical protein